MTRIGIIRCEKNEHKCPLTGCITCLEQRAQGFAGYDETKLAGIFTCRCPGEGIEDMARILKAKGAEAIHLPTCTFARKTDNKWQLGDGFCAHADDLVQRMSAATDLPCVKGTAHLPDGYIP